MKKIQIPLLACVFSSSLAMAASAPIGDRASSVLVTVDGLSNVAVRSIEGGGISATVVTSPGAGGLPDTKHLGPVKYEDFKFTFGDSTSGLIDWAQNFVVGKVDRRSGSVATCDASQNMLDRSDFQNGLISSITIPPLDGSSKDPAYLTVSVSPEAITSPAVTGKCVAQAPAPAGTQQFMSANFKLEIDGLADTRVSRIEAFTVTQDIVSGTVGAGRATTLEPGKLEYPNLVLTVPEADAKDFQTWFQDFVIKGNNGVAAEKSGAIVLLDPTLTKELLRINLKNVGIFRLAPVDSVAGADAVPSVSVSLYFNSLALVKQ
jgi:hypothetical protein